MDYEAIDRDMSSYVVTCKLKTTWFYLTPEGLATDILGNAQRYRWQDQAEKTAKVAREDVGWAGFDWEPISVPEAYVR